MSNSTVFKSLLLLSALLGLAITNGLEDTLGIQVTSCTTSQDKGYTMIEDEATSWGMEEDGGTLYFELTGGVLVLSDGQSLEFKNGGNSTWAGQLVDTQLDMTLMGGQNGDFEYISITCTVQRNRRARAMILI